MKICRKCGKEFKIRHKKKLKRIRNVIIRECLSGKRYKGRSGDIVFKDGEKKSYSGVTKLVFFCPYCEKKKRYVQSKSRPSISSDVS